jgi:hypothetical protein
MNFFAGCFAFGDRSNRSQNRWDAAFLRTGGRRFRTLARVDPSESHATYASTSEHFRVWPQSAGLNADPAERPDLRLPACRNLRQRFLVACIWAQNVL